ncbi:MAG: hypothetical protein ACRDWN_00560 [Acidimicrobiales bacterium]
MPTLQALQRRHELRALLTCTSGTSLVRVLPLTLLLAVGELVASLAVGDRCRARAVVDAWKWNARRAGELRRRRAALRRRRILSDRDVQALQLHGSARLSTYASRLAHQGFEVAHGVRPSAAQVAAGAAEGLAPVLTGSVGSAFSEDADFDELDDLGRRSGRDRLGRRIPRQVLGSRRSRLLVWGVAVVVLFTGTRHLFGGRLPLVGQYLPFLSWTGTWHHLVSAWQPAGVGTTAPASPGFAVLGVLGTVLLGHMGQLQKVLVLASLPVGAWGVSRLLGRFDSPRARLAGALGYLGLALPYDALARGRWDGLVAYAAAPWILARLARASGRAPFGGAGPPGGWRSTLPGQIVTLGAVETAAVALAPATSVMVVMCGVGLALGCLVVADWRAGLRSLGAACGATVLTAVLCAPWLVGTLAAGQGALSVLGMASPPSAATGWSQLLRFAVGPVGSSALSWLLLAAAVFPLLAARQARLAWAGRLWAVAGCGWLLALVSSRGWSGSFVPSVDVVLAPAAVAVASCIGIGVAAFETDLSGYAFGWRQAAAAAAVAAAAVGLLPVVASAASGRWNVPGTGYAQPLASLAATTSASAGGYRVLWLGAPAVLPTGSWPDGPQLAYATTDGGLPDATDLWMPASPGPASVLSRDVNLALQSRTVRLGRLLSVASVRYVVMVDGLAPDVTGGQPSLVVPAPAGLVRALVNQEDLLQEPTSAGGYQVFENTDFVPERAVRRAGLGGPAPTRAVQPTAADVAGWRRALPGDPGSRTYRGAVAGGTVLSSYAPGGSWGLAVGGQAARRQPAYGWAAQFRDVPAGPAVLRFRGSLLDPLAVLVEMGVWLAVVAALLGRRRWLDWWWRPVRSLFRRSEPRRARRRSLLLDPALPDRVDQGLLVPAQSVPAQSVPEPAPPDLVVAAAASTGIDIAAGDGAGTGPSSDVGVEGPTGQEPSGDGVAGHPPPAAGVKASRRHRSGDRGTTAPGERPGRRRAIRRRHAGDHQPEHGHERDHQPGPGHGRDREPQHARDREPEPKDGRAREPEPRPETEHARDREPEDGRAREPEPRPEHQPVHAREPESEWNAGRHR